MPRPKDKILDGIYLNTFPLYRVWLTMRTRCYNKNHDKYQYYGGKGITVCKAWIGNFAAFYVWAMANGYKKGLTLDRKKSKGNYTPKNCRWITHREQQLNRSNATKIRYQGQVKTISQWAAELKISRFKAAKLHNK